MKQVEELREMLKRVQEPKGFLLSDEEPRVTELLDALLVNKDRYGYMCCPCRLASGDRDKDRDIICPCVYREQDVREYGSCYCNLYVSRQWKDGTVEHGYVPERRPAEKMI
jgi:ferredoxin-thioredoxin reductase catalytic chain